MRAVKAVFWLVVAIVAIFVAIQLAAVLLSLRDMM